MVTPLVASCAEDFYEEKLERRDRALCACTEPILMPSGNCYECNELIHSTDRARAKPMVAYLIGRAFKNGHNCEKCIDREKPGYCAGLYWPLWNCHLEGVTESAIREVWPDFPGWPAWGHLDLLQNVSGGDSDG